MRFHPKVVGLPLSLVAAVLFLWIVNFAVQLARPNNPHRDIVVGIAVFVLVLLALSFAAFRSVYWDLTASGIVMHQLWKRREIPWSEVRSVGRLGNTSGAFSISIGHQIEDYDRVYIEPNNQNEFIAEIRRLAPNADFGID